MALRISVWLLALMLIIIILLFFRSWLFLLHACRQFCCKWHNVKLTKIECLFFLLRQNQDFYCQLNLSFWLSKTFCWKCLLFFFPTLYFVFTGQDCKIWVVFYIIFSIYSLSNFSYSLHGHCFVMSMILLTISYYVIRYFVYSCMV